MIERIKSIPDWSLELATIFDENIGNATIADQYTLFDMLKKKKIIFTRSIITNFMKTLYILL